MKLETGHLLGATWATINGDRIHAIGALIVLSGAGMLADRLGTGALIIASAANIFCSWFVTRTLMEREDLVRDRAVGFGSVLALSLISSFGIVLGFVFLIVPGVILTVRWVMALPIVLAGEEGPSDALRQSWNQTRGNVVPIFSAGVVVFLPFVIVLIAMVGLGFDAGAAGDAPADGKAALWVSLVSNIGISASSVAGWYLALTVYRELAIDDLRLQKVFA